MTTLSPSVSQLSRENVGALMSNNPRRPSKPVTGIAFYFSGDFQVTSHKAWKHTFENKICKEKCLYYKISWKRLADFFMEILHYVF
jgi:hypothetical protein